MLSQLFRSSGDQIRLDSVGRRWQDGLKMRLLAAALLVFIGLLFAGSVLPDHFSPPVAGAMLTGITFFLVVAVFIVLNAGKKVRQDSRTFEERLREMEAKGLLEMTELKARRAFEVEEFEDEGAHFFVELEDGSVLYLNGQYLYEYQPAGIRPRAFPCTEFVLVRNKQNGEVLDLEPRGPVLEPEAMLPTFSKAYYKNGPVWADGDVIRDQTYDQIKAELAKS